MENGKELYLSLISEISIIVQIVWKKSQLCDLEPTRQKIEISFQILLSTAREKINGGDLELCGYLFKSENCEKSVLSIDFLKSMKYTANSWAIDWNIGKEDAGDT